MAEDKLNSKVVTGRELVKGIPIEIKTAVHGVTISGLVKDVKISFECEEETFKDEQGLTCTHIASNPTMSMDFTVMAASDSLLPQAGDKIDNTGLAALGVQSTGTVIVSPGAGRSYSNEGVSEITFKAVWYPFLEESTNA